MGEARRPEEGRPAAQTAFRVPLAELRRRPGMRRPLHLAGPVGELVVAGSRVPADGEVELDAVAEVIEGGVTISGTLAVPWEGECRRCLGLVSGTLEVELSEVFEPDPTEGETYQLDHDHLDVLPVVRDAALLALPLAPLCTEVCAGPAPEAFPATVEGDDGAGDAEPTPDPRWAKLGELRFDE